MAIVAADGGTHWGFPTASIVGRALDTLAASLGAYIASVLEGVAPGISWPKLLEHKDASAGRAPMTYSPTDLSVQLRVMTESLGSLGYPFNLSHDARSYTSELRQTRNLWAHNETFNDSDTFRALDTASRLARHLALEDAAQALSALLDERKVHDAEEGASQASETDVESKTAGPKEPLQAPDHTLKQYPVSIEITAAESLSYAMVHNGFKFVRQIKITNPGTEIRGAVVRVEVFSSTGRISDPFQQFVDLAAGQAIVLDDVDVHVSASTMHELSDMQTGRVVVTDRVPWG